MVFVMRLCAWDAGSWGGQGSGTVIRRLSNLSRTWSQSESCAYSFALTCLGNDRAVCYTLLVGLLNRLCVVGATHKTRMTDSSRRSQRRRTKLGIYSGKHGEESVDHFRHVSMTRADGQMTLSTTT